MKLQTILDKIEHPLKSIATLVPPILGTFIGYKIDPAGGWLLGLIAGCLVGALFLVITHDYYWNRFNSEMQSNGYHYDYSRQAFVRDDDDNGTYC